MPFVPLALSDGRHPIWLILRPCALMIALGVFLSLTASHFDGGEVKAIGGLGLSSVIFDIFKRGVSTTT